MSGSSARELMESEIDEIMGADTTSVTRIDLFGVPIAAVTLAEAVDLVERAADERRRLDIGVVNAAKIVNMQTDSELRNSVLGSDIIFADGMSLVWAARLQRKFLPERVAGIDLMYALLERGNETGLRVYCLGAEEWVSQEVAQRIKDEYPGVRLVGYRNGYFSEEEQAGIADDVRKSGADVLFVAMSSPYKENFMARWADRMQVPVTHGVGGSFDVFAGKVTRAPRIMQDLGLEWLYRVMQEPRRLWRRYLHTNWVFIRMVVRAALAADR